MNTSLYGCMGNLSCLILFSQPFGLEADIKYSNLIKEETELSQPGCDIEKLGMENEETLCHQAHHCRCDLT